MKRLIAFLTLASLLTFGFYNSVSAQDDQTGAQTETQAVATDSSQATTQPATTATSTTLTAEDTQPKGFHQILKNYFIQGGAGFMAIVLLALIFGLAISIERIIYLSLATTNTQKLLNKIESALESSGVDAAKEVCKNTRGPVAGIFFQGLTRYDEGIDMVEKSIVSYGSVLMGRLESGLSWISLFIALAPMLGFLGTVIGMVQAFDNIEAAGDISPTIVAGGIKVALLTTVFGLIVAIILQIFFNFLVAKIDSLVNNMEDSSISFIDMLAKYKK
jgi:biopolymer transport protein ExbB